MSKMTVGEIDERVNILIALENKLRDGNDLDKYDRAELADILSDYVDLLLGIEVEVSI